MESYLFLLLTELLQLFKKTGSECYQIDLINESVVEAFMTLQKPDVFEPLMFRLQVRKEIENGHIEVLLCEDSKDINILQTDWLRVKFCLGSEIPSVAVSIKEAFDTLIKLNFSSLDRKKKELPEFKHVSYFVIGMLVEFNNSYVEEYANECVEKVWSAICKTFNNQEVRLDSSYSDFQIVAVNQALKIFLK